MERQFFGQVEDVVRSLLSGDLGQVRTRSHRSGVKVWFGSEQPPRVHYEAQLLNRKHIDATPGVALGIGFHAEDRDEAKNAALLEQLVGHEDQWRPMLGAEAVPGLFFGAPKWRRLSDVWLEPDLTEEDDDAAFEIAARLADYVNMLEPVLRLDQPPPG